MPCDDTIEPPLGSSFDDFVTYVAGLPTIESENADVTVDGYRGKHLEYSPGEEDDVDCRLSDYQRRLDPRRRRRSPDDRFPLGGDLDLDVPKKAVKAEIRQMVESIHFER